MALSSTIIYTSELILCSTICVPSATPHNIHMYPYFLFAAIHHLKSSPTFSVRPCSLVGRVTEDLIRRSWVRFPPRSKDFFFASVVPCFPLLGLTPSGLFMGLSSTIIYTSELILCSTIHISHTHTCRWRTLLGFVKDTTVYRNAYVLHYAEIMQICCAPLHPPRPPPLRMSTTSVGSLSPSKNNV